MIEINKTEIKPLKKNKDRWNLFALGFQNPQGIQEKKECYQEEKQRHWIDVLVHYHEEMNAFKKQENEIGLEKDQEKSSKKNFKKQEQEIWESWNVVAPYDEWLVFWAKNLGGRWNMETKSWTLEGPKEALEKAWVLFQNVQLTLENDSKDQQMSWEKERKKDYFFEKQDMKLALEEKNGMLGYWVSFPYDQSHVDEIRSLRVAQWNRDEKKWFIPLDKSFKMKNWIDQKEKDEDAFQTKKAQWKTGQWKWYGEQEESDPSWSWEHEEVKLESIPHLKLLFSHDEKTMEHELTIQNFSMALCPFWLKNFDKLSQFEVKRKGYSGVQRALWNRSSIKDEIKVRVSWEHQEELKKWHQNLMEELKVGVPAQLTLTMEEKNWNKDDFFEWDLNWSKVGVPCQGSSWPEWTKKAAVYGVVLERINEKQAKIMLFSSETMLNVLKKNEIWFQSVWQDQKRSFQEWGAWVECLEIKKCTLTVDNVQNDEQTEDVPAKIKIKRL